MRRSSLVVTPPLRACLFRRQKLSPVMVRYDVPFPKTLGHAKAMAAPVRPAWRAAPCARTCVPPS